MDETPELSVPHHLPTELREAPRRLGPVLDGLSLLGIGWAAVLWQLGSNSLPAGLYGPEADGSSGGVFPAIREPWLDRTRLSLGLLVLAVPFVVTVLATFGRRPGPLRWLAAAPVLAGLVAVGVWRFIEGVILRPHLLDRLAQPVLNAGSWDGQAASLALAAVLLAAVRQYRLTRGLQVFATLAVLLSVAATVIEPVLYFQGLGSLGGYFLLVVDLLAPSLAWGLLGLVMAPVWLYLLARGYLRGAAGVMTWGSVVAAGLLWPANLSAFSVAVMRTPISGLDWPQGLLAAAAAVLVAPVVTMYRLLDRSGRALLLSAPLAVLAQLLIAHFGGLLIGFRMLVKNSPIPLDVAQPMEQVTMGATLLGAALVLGIALRPRAARAPLVMLVATVLITIPTALFLVPEALGEAPGPDSLRNFPSMLVPMLSWWNGAEIVLSFVLPGLLFGLMAANQWWGRAAPVPAAPVLVESGEPVTPTG